MHEFICGAYETTSKFLRGYHSVTKNFLCISKSFILVISGRCSHQSKNQPQFFFIVSAMGIEPEKSGVKNECNGLN